MSVLETSLIAEARRGLKYIQEVLAGEYDELAERYAEAEQVPLQQARRFLMTARLNAFLPLDNLAGDPDSGLSVNARKQMQEYSRKAYALAAL
ncbi:hypothetical protein [Microbulbifer sp. ZKSA002]|uniref:hypothetical protein n=1 Tax=Microbulbifer sp. ZKSA002 TaxID=3243388 RepID=UPI004039EBA6